MKLPPLFRSLLSVLALAGCLAAPASLHAAEATNKKCPIMTTDDADTEYTVDVGGVPVALCCTKCAKLWKKSDDAKKYYARVALDLGLLPQLKGKEKELGLDKVQLLPQRYCPLNTTTLISPESPSTEYKGVKVYFYNEKALGEWNKDPEKHAKKAIDAGLLPQLAGK